MPVRNRRRHGAAMITALIMMGLLATIIAALLMLVHNQNMRTIAGARTIARNACAATGLQYGRAFFARNFANWSNGPNYLGTPNKYNPVKSAWNVAPSNPLSGALQASNPELFVDVDGDGRRDVYIYIRDNPDELLPAPENWARDNDQIAYVGAVCISPTMAPHRPDGTLDPDLVSVEGLLNFNIPDNGYSSQAGAGTSGTGNIN
ncbi:MAG: hypothetical protein U0228_10875 [Myxococcaceae bacterium]